MRIRSQLKRSRIVLVVAFAILLVFMQSIAAGDVALNGSAWNQISIQARIFWLVGYDSGFVNGVRMAASLKSSGNSNAVAPATVREAILLRNLVRYTNSPHFLSNQEVMDEMTLFYKDFRNTPVCWANAEPIAELALTMGAPSEQELVAIRSEDAKDGCSVGQANTK